MSAVQPHHPLAEPFAAALFGAEPPDPIEFLMLLTEVSQLPPPEYAAMWTNTVELGRGTPATPRERAQYALSSPVRVAEAKRLATMLGEATPVVQGLVVKTLRLSLRRQVNGAPVADPPAVGPSVGE